MREKTDAIETPIDRRTDCEDAAGRAELDQIQIQEVEDAVSGHRRQREQVRIFFGVVAQQAASPDERSVTCRPGNVESKGQGCRDLAHQFKQANG